MKILILGAIVPNNEVIIVHRDTVIEAEDHVILCLTNKRPIKGVACMFQAGFNFF